jgi:hypothetical protein
MNPSLMNYLQNNQSSNQMTGTQPQTRPAAQPGQDSYNPFDAGIQKAISSARQSLGMTQDQQENAFNNSLLAFGDSMAQTPREKGFLNNVGSIGRALSPALKTYDQSENAAMAENQSMANQILQYQAAEQARQAQAEERAWHRQHAERQLGEQSRYHDLMNERMSGRRGQGGKTKEEEHSDSSNSELSNIFNQAEKLLTGDLKEEKTYRGRTSNFLSRFTLGGYIPSKEQAKVNALGDVLRGKLFNAWGYRNQAEFEHVPSISADNPPDVNLQIIQTLKGLLQNAPLEGQQNLGQVAPPASATSTEQPGTEYVPDDKSVKIYRGNKERWVHPDDLAVMEADGWERDE